MRKACQLITQWVSLRIKAALVVQGKFILKIELERLKYVWRLWFLFSSLLVDTVPDMPRFASAGQSRMAMTELSHSTVQLIGAYGTEMIRLPRMPVVPQ